MNRPDYEKRWLAIQRLHHAADRVKAASLQFADGEDGIALICELAESRAELDGVLILLAGLEIETCLDLLGPVECVSKLHGALDRLARITAIRYSGMPNR
jgi:hypothetical protein